MGRIGHGGVGEDVALVPSLVFASFSEELLLLLPLLLLLSRASLVSLKTEVISQRTDASDPKPPSKPAMLWPAADANVMARPRRPQSRRCTATSVHSRNSSIGMSVAC
jgi:hypothetical protein